MFVSAEATDCECFDVLASSSVASERQRAQSALYERHAGYLAYVLEARAGRLLAAASLGADDLLQETFVRAFARAASYRCLAEVEGQLNLDEQTRELESRRTRAWLGRIAQRLLADQIAARREVAATPSMDDMVDPGPPSSDSAGALVVRQALEQLSDRERDVLRVTALYHRVGERHQRLPNEVARRLAERWGLTAANVRAIRKRALEKVRRFVEGSSRVSEPLPRAQSASRSMTEDEV